MIGTLINIATVLIGSLLGNLLGSRLPERLKETIIAGLGIFVLGYGLQMFLKTQNALLVLGSLLLGALLGEWLQIEDRLQSLGGVLERRFTKAQVDDTPQASSSRFIRGFLTASLVFCVGPMTILGSIRDGMAGDHSLLVVKSVLDGFGALAFASSLGLGVSFSVLIILVYQGGLSLLATQVQAFMTPDMMIEMTAVGGLILVAIALSSLLEIKKIRAGNFLPALFLAPVIVAILAVLNQ
jgi:uncharacterized protein